MSGFYLSKALARYVPTAQLRFFIKATVMWELFGVEKKYPESQRGFVTYCISDACKPVTGMCFEALV